MNIKINEIHPADDKAQLNTEWFILENTGDKAFSTKNCSLGVTRKGSKKRIELGNMDPGFTIAPGESMRIITGNPGRKAHGKPPSDDTGNYHLFLGSPVLRGKGTVLVLSLRSLPLTTAEFDPDGKNCLAAD